jgi:hypothetical protein
MKTGLLMLETGFFHFLQLETGISSKMDFMNINVKTVIVRKATQ